MEQEIQLTDFAQRYVDAVFAQHGIPVEMTAEQFIEKYRIKTRRDCEGCMVADICRGYVYLGNDYLCLILDDGKARVRYKAPHSYRAAIPEELVMYLNAMGNLKTTWIETRINRHVANGTVPQGVDYAKAEYTQWVTFSVEGDMHKTLAKWGSGSAKIGFTMLLAEFAREQLVMPHSRRSRTNIYVYPELPDRSTSGIPKT